MNYVTVKEAAGRLGYHQSHVRRLCADGRLKAVKHAGQWYVERNCVSGRRSFSFQGLGQSDFPYVSTAELCELLGLSNFAVRRRIKLGRLPAAKDPFRVYAIPRSALDSCKVID